MDKLKTIGATALVTAGIVGGVMYSDPASAEEVITVDANDTEVVDEQKDVKIEVTKTVTESVTTDIETLQKEIGHLNALRERVQSQLNQIDADIQNRNDLIVKIQVAINNSK